MKKRDSVVSEPINSPLAEGPDSVLIAASNCARGGAFDVLVERYRATLFSVAFRITRNPEDAEDLVQQSFQKAFLQLPSFEAKSSFATWLINIATHEAHVSSRNRAGRPVSPDEIRLEHKIAPPKGFPHEAPNSEEKFAP